MNSKNEEKIYQSIGVEPVINSVTDGMAAEHTRSDHTNGLLATKTVGGQRIGGGHRHVRNAGAPEYVVGVLIVQKNYAIHELRILGQLPSL